MAISNRKKIWKFLKKTLCPTSNNEVIPIAVINLQQNNFVATDTEATETETKEILSVLTITLTITGHIINFVLISLIKSSTSTTRTMLALSIMAITHISWVAISQKLRQFTMELIAPLRN